MGTSINYKAVLLYGVLFGALVVALLYFLLPAPNPIRTCFTSLATSLGLTKLDLSGITNWISTQVQSNWMSITALGATTIPLLYTTVRSYFNQKKAEKELTAFQDITTTTLQKAQTKIDSLEQKIKEYEGDTTSTTLQERLSGLITDNGALKDQLLKLEAANKELARQPALLAENLWAKSGGQTITEDGHVYRIIEKTILSVK